MLPAIDEPLTIVLVEGEVVFLGPGAVNFSMTLAGAHQTWERLSQTLATLADENAPRPRTL